MKRIKEKKSSPGVVVVPKDTIILDENGIPFHGMHVLRRIQETGVSERHHVIYGLPRGITVIEDERCKTEGED